MDFEGRTSSTHQGVNAFMSMFKELFQLALGATLTLTISADEKQGRMSINVSPKLKNDSGEPALSTPLVLTATPEEFEAEFVNVLNRYRTAHVSLAQQAQVTQELLDAAKAASAKKGTGAVAKASAKPAPATTKPAATAAADSHDDAASEDEHEDEADAATDSPGTPVESTTGAAAQAQDTEPQLFG
jgi:PRTRC genetic system protein E